MIRIVDRVAAASLVLCWLALPAAADGLTRFKEAIKDAPPGALTFKSAKALGDNGFVLEGVVVTPPPDSTPAGKTEPIEIKRIAVEDFDFAAIDKNAPPNFIKMRVEGIVIGAKPAEGIDLAELAGIDKITADFQLDYRLDPEKKTMTLNRLELDLNGLARMELSMILDGVSAESVDKPEAAMNDATLRTATLLFEDRSLFSKVLPAAAKMQSVEADGLVKIGKVMLDGLRTWTRTGDGRRARRAGLLSRRLQTAQRAVAGDPQPAGQDLRRRARRHDQPGRGDRGIGAGGVLCRDPAPHQSRPRRCRPGRAPRGPPGAESRSCTPGTRYFVMHEDAWWSVTAREASKSGDRCIARIDGGGDDDVTFALDKTLAWSIDGPGKPVAKWQQRRQGAGRVQGWRLVRRQGRRQRGRRRQMPDQVMTATTKSESVELKKVRRLD